MQEKIQFTSKVISLGSEENNLYMELSMVFLDNIENLNNVRFTDDFLADVETNKSKYIGLPLVGDVNALTTGNYQDLTHLFNQRTGDFLTQALGSFVDFKTEINDGVNQLIATARVWKRYPKVCLAMQELFNSEEGLSFSYEVLVGKYAVESGCKIIDKDISNTIASSCVVSNPANPNSIALTLCAAVEEDLSNVSKNNTNFKEEGSMTIEELNLEVASLKLEIASKDAKLKESDTKIKEQDTKLCSKEADAKAKDKELETTKDELKNKNTEVESKVEDAKAKDKEVAEVNEKLAVLSASVLEKDKQIKDFEPIKKAHEEDVATKEADKKAADKKALKEKFSKVLSAEVMAEVEIAEAFENLDESKLNSKVVELAMASLDVTPKSVASVITASTVIGKNSLQSKYITINE